MLDVLVKAPQRELLSTTPLQKPKLIGQLQLPTEPIGPLPETGDLVLTLGDEDSVLVAVMASIMCGAAPRTPTPNPTPTPTTAPPLPPHSTPARPHHSPSAFTLNP